MSHVTLMKQRFTAMHTVFLHFNNTVELVLAALFMTPMCP